MLGVASVNLIFTLSTKDGNGGRIFAAAQVMQGEPGATCAWAKVKARGGVAVMHSRIASPTHALGASPSLKPAIYAS